MGDIRDRKSEHLKICLSKDVSSGESSYWDQISLPHCALPNLDQNEIDLSCSFLGERYAAPILISSMTGGTPESDRINERLAVFAEEVGLPMGVGSQRVLLENRSSSSFQLRKIAPKARLFANIGAVQLNYGVSVDALNWLVDHVEAQGLFLHLNPLQEAIQTEGNRNFSKLWEKIAELKKRISVPVILKETGCGLDGETLKRAREIGIDAIDVAGRGGTHWGYIEGLRNAERRSLGEIFRNWGIPTPTALENARAILGPAFPIIASGGIRHGLDCARTHYLGADMAGLALPFLRAANEGEVELRDFFAFLKEGLRVTLFCSGQKSPLELKKHGERRKN